MLLCLFLDMLRFPVLLYSFPQLEDLALFGEYKIDILFKNQKRKDAAKMTAKKWSAKRENVLSLRENVHIMTQGKSFIISPK